MQENNNQPPQPQVSVPAVPVSQEDSRMETINLSDNAVQQPQQVPSIPIPALGPEQHLESLQMAQPQQTPPPYQTVTVQFSNPSPVPSPRGFENQPIACSQEAPVHYHGDEKLHSNKNVFLNIPEFRPEMEDEEHIGTYQTVTFKREWFFQVLYRWFILCYWTQPIQAVCCIFFFPIVILCAATISDHKQASGLQCT